MQSEESDVFPTPRRVQPKTVLTEVLVCYRRACRLPLRAGPGASQKRDVSCQAFRHQVRAFRDSRHEIYNYIRPCNPAISALTPSNATSSLTCSPRHCRHALLQLLTA